MKARLIPLVAVSAFFLAGQSWAAEPAKAVKPATSVEELLAGMPKDVWPVGGKDGVPERKAAEEWMRKNVVGRRVEWTAKVTDLVFVDAGKTLTARFKLGLFVSHGG